MSANEFPKAAYTLGIVSGALILLNGLLLSLASALAVARAGLFYRFGPYGGYMMYRPYMWPGIVFFGMAVFGLICGILVLISAIMVRRNPENYAWGTLMIIFSVLSFFSMGGFIVGAILGIIAGALAVTWHK